MLVLIGFDKRYKNFHLVRLWRSLKRLEHAFQALECSAQIVVVSDWLNIH